MMMILSGRQNWSWFLWRGGDFFSSTVIIVLYYGFEQIKKRDTYRAYNRQERGGWNVKKSMCVIKVDLWDKTTEEIP
jgi:hypothetical protein